jgi:hypothetical protein
MDFQNRLYGFEINQISSQQHIMAGFFDDSDELLSLYCPMKFKIFCFYQTLVHNV